MAIRIKDPFDGGAWAAFFWGHGSERGATPRDRAARRRARFQAWVMCAAMGHEKAEGVSGHGLFTQALLEALEKKPGVPVPFNRRNQRVYIHHLHSFVFDEVSTRSEERQHPFLSLPWVVESFVVR